MAEVASASGLRVAVSTFEEWDSDGRLFDVLTAGRSWHWVNPTQGAKRFAHLERRSYTWERSYTTWAWLDELPTRPG
jgi:hypothetical protein